MSKKARGGGSWQSSQTTSEAETEGLQSKANLSTIMRPYLNNKLKAKVLRHGLSRSSRLPAWDPEKERDREREKRRRRRRRRRRNENNKQSKYRQFFWKDFLWFWPQYCSEEIIQERELDYHPTNMGDPHTFEAGTTFFATSFSNVSEIFKKERKRWTTKPTPQNCHK
jgi:hypothetical protein